MDKMNGGILHWFVHQSLKFRGIIISLALMLIIYGVFIITRAHYDVFPEFAPPEVTIQTEAPGLSAKQVEKLVTTPIENAVNGIHGIRTLRSGSIQGISVIHISFRSGSNIYQDRQLVSERLTTVTNVLPQGVKPPVMTPLTSSTSTVMVIGLTSPTKSLTQLRTVADWIIRQRILAVQGVAKIATFGGKVKELQIQPVPDKLYKYHLSLNKILSIAKKATAIKGAGFIDNSNQHIILQTEGQSITPSELSHVVVAHKNGKNILLGQVANVKIGSEPSIGAATIMGKNGVVINISAQYGANTITVTQNLEKALKSLKQVLKKQNITLYPDLFRPANFIHTAINHVRTSLLIGAILVIIILTLFLFNLRSAAISCLAIPLSLLAAIIVMEKMGISLNTMTLGGLAIAIGEVVDDAVIDVENILRRLQENRRKDHPESVFTVILNASIEVRSAVVYATLAVVLVFVPVLTMSGLAGRLFAPLGLAYIFAILASLVVALTVTPALSYLLLGSSEKAEAEPPIVNWLKKYYTKILRVVENYYKSVVSFVLIFTFLGLFLLHFFGGGFLPELKEGHYIVHMLEIPGTSLRQSVETGKKVTAALIKLPFVRSVAQRAGRADLADDIHGTYNSEFEVDFKPNAHISADEAKSEMRKALSKITGIAISMNTFLTERIRETFSGYSAPIVINIFGNNLNELDHIAKKVAGVLRKVPDSDNIRVQSPTGMPEVMIKLKKSQLQRWGFDPVNVLNDISTAYSGTKTGQIYQGDRDFNVAVILPKKIRNSVADIKELPLESPGGKYIHLSQIANVYETSGRYSILHNGARRVQTVSCNVTNRDVKHFMQSARKMIHSEIHLPTGTYIVFSGAGVAQAKSRNELLLHSILAGILIIMLLSVVTKHYNNLLLILLNLPFALVGGVLAVFFTGGYMTIGSLVGFVTLFGITLRNSIMLISHFDHLVKQEGYSWNLETAIKGASERLTPILMTALVTAFGLLPLALGSGTAGREIEGPMAIVILGGLATSTALNLLVLPTLALRFGRFEKLSGSEEL